VKPVVVDASALLSFLLNDHPPTAHRVEAAIARCAEAPLIAPVLLRAELANALAMAVRRSRLTPAQAKQAAAFADGLPIGFDPQDADVAALLMAANAHGLTAYDALYLELAMLRGADLLTADGALGKAARRAGVSVPAE
jgi:predicted nucleic acid-binding protein